MASSSSSSPAETNQNQPKQEEQQQEEKKSLFGFTLPSDWNIETHEWPQDKRFFEQLQAQNRSLQLQWNWIKKEEGTNDEKELKKTQEQQPSQSK